MVHLKKDYKMVFGPWKYDKSTNELILVEDGAEVYFVDLDRCATCASMLDWIFQVRAKSWATPAVVSGLLDGLNATMRPQEKMCSLALTTGVPSQHVGAVVLAACRD